MASSSSITLCKYDVFLSFRGLDMRQNFIYHLHAALVRAGINTFIDDLGLKRGEPIGPELLKVIEESRFSIVVLSENYASSTWCLDELVHILECRRTLGHTVLPVFYDIDPLHVRNQKTSFAEAFGEYEEPSKDVVDKVERWRAALREVADLNGLVLQNPADGYELKDIDDIVKEILNRLHQTELSFAFHPVGLHQHAEKVISMLSDDSLNICIVSIYGIGGIGKTTLANMVYNSISHKFQASCFLANVRQNSDPERMIQLQRQLLSETLMENCQEIYSVDRGLKVIEERLCCKSVLIVLDDVDELNQLNQLLGDCFWFSPGSRVLITTRIKDMLKPSPLYKQYKVQELDDNESLQLLSLHAFDTVHPIKDYMECAQSLVRYAGGIPLALKILGTSLYGKSIDVWNSTLKKLKVIGHQGIHTSLKISYDSLDEVHKSLFLDIACFFVGFDKDSVIRILDDCGVSPITGINDLMNRCLMSIDFDNKLMMHDLLRDMGREIVRQESPMEPGYRSRLWRPEDAWHVLVNETGGNQIEGLILNLPGQNKILTTKEFKKMNRLRLLQLNYVHLTGSFKYFPRKLRWLCWHGFPLGSIPSDLHLGNLVALDMQHSKLNQFLEDVTCLVKLKSLDLSHSRMLTKISNFEGFPNLEILNLEDCISLVEIHDSITVLTRLHSLNLRDCKSLLPKSICTLRSLEYPIISGCSKHEKLPTTIGNLEPSPLEEDTIRSIVTERCGTGKTKEIVMRPPVANPSHAPQDCESIGTPQVDGKSQVSLFIEEEQPDVIPTFYPELPPVCNDSEDERNGDLDKGSFHSLEEVTEALREAGLKSPNLIFGTDFSKSNEWAGEMSFNNQNLHTIGDTPNPYEQVISIIGKTLASFHDDNSIPCFGLGFCDATTCDEKVFRFQSNSSPYHGYEELLATYRDIVADVQLSGPTSYAPVIEAAIDIVQRSGGQYHVLVIIANGKVIRCDDINYEGLIPQEEKTVRSIVTASSYPLSIVLVGVGDGPWEDMTKFISKIPFISFTDNMSKDASASEKEAEFAFAALKGIPFQYKAAIELDIIGRVVGRVKGTIVRPPPVRRFCPVCWSNGLDMTFGCGHLICSACASKLHNCPLCRQPIRLRITLSN